MGPPNLLVKLLFSISLLASASPLPAGQTEFLEAPQYATGQQPQSVAIGDFNGDGNPDLAIADLASNKVSVLLGRGDGSFRPSAGARGFRGFAHPLRCSSDCFL